MKSDFESVSKWMIENGRFKNGIDVGCGTNRLSPDVLSLDVQPDLRYASAQIVWNCKDLEFFNDGVLDFIFSSHCLEDFENIPDVFCAWWKKIKPNGLMILLLPDMQSGRYPKCSDPKGNPSHRTDTGKAFMEGMLQGLMERGKIKYKMEQIDTIPHDKSSSIDFVIRKIK